MNSKLCILLLVAVAACVSAAPKPGALLAYTAPSPVVTATSSQFIARNYNGFAAPYVAAPVAAPYVSAPYVAASPYVASPYAAYTPYAPYAPYAAAYQSAVIV